jgi:hypothetical protein
MGSLRRTRHGALVKVTFGKLMIERHGDGDGHTCKQKKTEKKREEKKKMTWRHYGRV